MRDLVDWLRAESNVHPVLTAGIAQFQLVHIHPFLDGNGRTSRLLSTLALYRAGYDFKRLFTLSEFYDRDRTAFYRAIQSVRGRDVEPRAGRIAKLRVLWGLELDEIAQMLGVSRSTVDREWRFARRWLMARLGIAERKRPSPGGRR